jgi:hypothetical protein
VAEGQPAHALGLLAVGIGLARELSGEAQMDRAQQTAGPAGCCHAAESGGSTTRDPKSVEAIYLEVTDHRFKGVRRCC